MHFDRGDARSAYPLSDELARWLACDSRFTPALAHKPSSASLGFINQSKAVSFSYDFNLSGSQVGITSGLRPKTPALVGGVKASFVVQFVVQLSRVPVPGARGRCCLIVGWMKRVGG